MHPLFLLIPPILAFAGGGLILLLHIRDFRVLSRFALGVTSAVSLGVLGILLFAPSAELELIRFTSRLTLIFRLDAMGRFFIGIIAALWPLTVLYAGSYMKGEEHTRLFFGFFLWAYGVTLGIAFAGNLFTMYCFYEMLTLVTVPLVMQPMTREAVHAARMYLIFSLGGAAFAFASMVFLICEDAGGLFAVGGFALAIGEPRLVRLFWLFGFLGFGVKAAVFPLHHWLPKAAVAPTPVTALLHAVAVVKAGAFAVIRLTWFAYGPEVLSGTWVQTAALLLTAWTILYGSAMAVRETHWKRRMAYSTVSNLSYILFGALLLTPDGLTAGLAHMAVHACIKILAFFAVGAVLKHSNRVSLYELDGLGRAMPVTFACFTVAAAALTGVPPFNGFFSKWLLLTASADAGTPAAWIGCGAILLSAMLTAVYMFTAVRRAYFPDREADLSALSFTHEADARMLVPMVILAAGCLLFGLWTQPILQSAAAVFAG